MSSTADPDDVSIGTGSRADDLGLEVPEADAAEQGRDLVDESGAADPEVPVPASGALERVTDTADPVNEADAAEQARAVDDDEGYDDHR